MIAALRKATQAEPKVPNLEFKPGMSSAEVERLLEVARTDAERKAEALETVRAEYRDDPSLERKHLEMAAEVERDIADKMVQRLERERTVAQEREAEEARQRKYDHAAERARAIPDQKRRWDDLCGQLAALMTQIQEDTRTIEGANGNLPKGAQRLPTLEQSRGQPSRTEKATTQHEGWIVAATGEPYREAVRLNENGVPSVRGITRGSWTEVAEKFTPAFQPPRLADTLALPSVAGDKLWPTKE